jgi:nitrite reductase (NADH) large subunit
VAIEEFAAIGSFACARERELQMSSAPIVEIREPGLGVRRLELDHPIEVGRECDGENLADPGVSRRHLRLVPTPVGLSLVDLESRNGTRVNGEKVTGRVVLQPGDVVRLGDSEIVMVGRTVRATEAALRCGRARGPGARPGPASR